MEPSIPAKHNDKTLLGELVFELGEAEKKFSEETEGKPIFLTEVKMNGCKREVFCQAEQVLIKKVSGRSGAKFDRFRTDKKLMRNLNMYNQHHVKTCELADEGQDEILLHAFLKKFLNCVKSAYSQAK